jgi:MoCo/4Fe-4S cofactor protein with predicted Tat translocation signal
MTTNDRQRDGQMDIAAIRARLAASHGKEYWRSLEELAGSEAFQESLRREFPGGAEEWKEVTGRRRFLQLMGASLGGGGV